MSELGLPADRIVEVPMKSKGRFVLLALTALMAALVLAVPALAASNMTKGDSELLVPTSMVTELQSKHVTINAIAPVQFVQRWSNSKLSWWFKVPMALKSGASYSTYDKSTGKGTFYHSGMLAWVDAGQTAHKGLKWQGLRIVATDKTHYFLVATVGNKAPYIPNMNVAQSTGSIKITHSGKKYHIDGIKFKLLPTAQTELAQAIGETISTSQLLFDSDIYFTMK
jgi:hypothetical protein